MGRPYHKSTRTQYPEFLGLRPNAEFRAEKLNTGFSENEGWYHPWARAICALRAVNRRYSGFLRDGQGLRGMKREQRRRATRHRTGCGVSGLSFGSAHATGRW